MCCLRLQHVVEDEVLVKMAVLVELLAADVAVVDVSVDLVVLLVDL